MPAVYISGALGRGIWLDGDAVLTSGADGAVRTASSREIAQVTASDGDYQLEHVDDLSAVSDAINKATKQSSILFLVLSVINSELSIASRLVCAKALDPLLDQHSRALVLARLLSKPLPSEARIELPATQEYFRSFENLATLLREISESQDAIVTLDGAFQHSTKDLQTSERDEIRAEFVEYEIYPPLVEAIRNLNKNNFNTAVITALLRIKGSCIQPQVAMVLNSIRKSLLPVLDRQTDRQKDLILLAAADDRAPSRRRHRDIDELLSEDPIATLSRISSFQAKTAVDKQIAGIRRQILAGREDLVEKYLAELVRFQVENSEKHHLAKSLSLLTSVALAANQISIADRLSLYAMKAEQDDPVVFTTRAEVLKYQGLFAAALQAYQDAKLRFPECAYAWNGEADVLKEAGRYEDAVAAYKIVRARFAADPVPFNGLVSTFRRMGRLQDATREALKNLKRFSDDPSIRTEFGNVLAARGRYKEAGMQFKRVLNSDPHHIHALLAYIRVLNYTGERARALSLLQRYARTDAGPVILNAIATQLYTMGKLDDALEKAKALLSAFPGYTPAKFTLASVLLLLGEPASAIKELPKVKLRSESDWTGYKIYLTCMLQGDSGNAIKLLENAREECVWERQKARISTILAVAYARAQRVKEAQKILEEAPKLADEHHKQTRFALLGALNARMGRKEISQTIMTRILRSSDPTILKFKTSILTHSIRPKEVIPILLAA